MKIRFHHTTTYQFDKPVPYGLQRGNRAFHDFRSDAVARHQYDPVCHAIFPPAMAFIKPPAWMIVSKNAGNGGKV